ncbi:dysbindin-A-like isoform X2 [Melanotaenia boesemani]|uniref:dysbindin-A-like isoform X2 n=1 Tax=Melanotaenia boesemani TaxID=1250792 RepID=UPI001C054599|nr:dysbindin-A-like isoform X2 [Melanotaenia boesemani]
MFENFRERLHLVQQDFSSGFEESLPHLRAGLEILSRYEESWFLLHKRTKDCAQAAEAADGDIVMLSAHWERRRAALSQLQEQLQNLPDFISELDAITANIAHLEGDFEEMESRLVYLETLCFQCDQQSVKKHHMNQLEVYKKQKRKEMELLEVELNAEHAQRVAELEQALQQKLRERQKVYEEAFNQDVETYLSTGHLQNRAESAAADVSNLDQMMVANISDQEALDDFLNSTADDFSTGSSLTSGPDLPSCSSEASSQAPPTNSQQSSQQEEACSEESEEQLVQSDEDDVQPDMELAGLQDGGVVWASDESDSAVDEPSHR